MKTKILLNKLAKRFPKRLAKIYHDHVGHMTGILKEDIHKILLCLDLDWELLDEVKKVKPDLIITHHPFIYGSKYRVFKHDLSKKELCEQIDALDIPVYSYHTNFDAGKDGMNDALARALNLQSIYSPEKMGMMRIGYLEKEMGVETFAKFAKESFGVNYSLLISNGKQIIKKVGIIGGGGSRYWNIAKDEECDIYISGDAPHYVRRDIVNNKFNYLDMPHEIEHIFMPQMKKLLLDINPNLDIIEIDHEKLPMVI
jgi:dinuclear metal center YbgI/SA1388 family protein